MISWEALNWATTLFKTCSQQIKKQTDARVCGQWSMLSELSVAIIEATTGAVEPRYKEGPRDWKNTFAIMWFRYIEVLFHIFCYYCGQEYHLLYQGLRFIEVQGSTVFLLPLHCTPRWDASILQGGRPASS